ncbi:hypothetical protein BT93_G1074 [Corymbia citriodora subsp. variegata]|nr:hypothetical protein BT93_G1074 [Corymbia citriodora subsp. variegata]
MSTWASKWEKPVTSGRKRISHPGVNVKAKSSLATEKGHFVIYTTDEGCFVIPLQCLCSNIFKELFQIIPPCQLLALLGSVCRTITVPYDAASMEYIVSLVQRCVAKDIEKALLNSIPFTPCSLAAAVHNKSIDQQALSLGQ